MMDAASTVLVAGLDGVEMTSSEIDFYREEKPSGVTLFRRNVSEDFRRVKALNDSLQKLIGQDCPGIVAIDQEGGRVRRIREPFPDFGPALELFSDDEEGVRQHKIRNYGRVVGSSLRELGVNVNFAPVLDILTNENNTAIGDRVFARDAKLVSQRAGAFLEGMQAAGVKGCLKHFPGQGDADFDTHLSSAVIDYTKEELWNREISPFRDLAHSCDLMMISHAIYPAYDSKPASVSKVIMEDLLRGELSYQGLVVSDDMNMEAINQDKALWQASLVEAVANGADLLLVCQGLDKFKIALEGLRSEARKSKAFHDRLEVAASRIIDFRKTLK